MRKTMPVCLSDCLLREIFTTDNRAVSTRYCQKKYIRLYCTVLYCTVLVHDTEVDISDISIKQIHMWRNNQFSMVMMITYSMSICPSFSLSPRQLNGIPFSIYHSITEHMRTYIIMRQAVFIRQTHYSLSLFSQMSRIDLPYLTITISIVENRKCCHYNAVI